MSNLMAHQLHAADIADAHPRFGFWHDTGTGKTAAAIEIIRRHAVKTLVVCPISIIRCAWIEDLAKFWPEARPVNLWEARQKKNPYYHQALADCKIGIVNFETFSLMMKNHEIQGAGFKLTIFDESSKLKNIKAQVTKRAIAWSDTQDYVYLLSGTPAPNSELEYWPQVRCLSPVLFGHSFYSWRARWCYPTGYENHVWKLRPESKPEFYKALAQVSEVVRREDVLDLPERTFNIREVTLDANEMQSYHEMKDAALLELLENQQDHDSISIVRPDMKKRHLMELDGHVELRPISKIKAVNAGAKLMKLREGTSGFYLDEEGRAHDVGASKLKELSDLLEEIGDHQVLIWFHFHHEGDQIERMLNSHGTVGRVDGTIGNQNIKDQTVKNFQNGQNKYLLAHPASLGHGVTLTNCHYAIYFSLSHSLELHLQSQDRIYRKGQTKPCSYYFLVAKNTVDGVILKALERKKSVVDEVMNFIIGGEK